MGRSRHAWHCIDCGQPVFRTYGAAAAVQVADVVDVRIRVEGACAEHLSNVQQLLNSEVSAGGVVVSRRDVQPLRPQDVVGWAATVRIDLGRDVKTAAKH